MKVKAESNLLGIKVVAQPHNSKGPDGLRFKLFVDGELMQDEWFVDGGSRHLYCYMPGIKGKEIEIETEVDKTFKPFDLGINEDRRELGVVISPVWFLKIMPKEGVGFYHGETLDSQSAKRIAHSAESKEVMKFRWTGRRASLPIEGLRNLGIEELKDGGTVFLRCGHPDIGNEPVVVKIRGDSDLLRQVEFDNHDWRKVVFEGKELDGVEVMTFEVSRTWNPKRMGVSEDGRDLGVGVVIY